MLNGSRIEMCNDSIDVCCEIIGGDETVTRGLSKCYDVLGSSLIAT